MIKRTMYNQYVSKKSKQVQLPLLYRMLKKFEEHRFTTIIKQLPKNKKVTCLELGCGTGDFAYAAQFHFNLLLGTDLLPELIAHAKKKSFDIKTKFFQHDASKQLFVKSNSLELVVSIATLQYVTDLEVLFSEVHRLLKPGGMFIFEVPNFLVFWRRLQLLIGEFPSTSLYHEEWDGGVVHYFTEKKLRDYCRAHGFIVTEVTSSGIFSGVRKLWPSLLGANLIFVCKKPL